MSDDDNKRPHEDTSDLHEVEVVEETTRVNDRKNKPMNYAEYYQFRINQKTKKKEAVCQLCLKNKTDKVILMSKGNTSGVKRHLLGKHAQEISFSTDTEMKEISKNVSDIEFKEMLVEWTAAKKLPFNFFNDDLTQNFFKTINPDLTYPKRTCLTQQTITHFQKMKSAVMVMLGDLKVNFSFTTDAWTSVANQSYYGVTLHFIDKNWEMQSIEIAFIPSKGQHSGQNIANFIYGIITEYNLLRNVRGITVDNASANTTFLEKLKPLFKRDNINFDPVNSHFKCFAHVLNLGALDTMKVLKLTKIQLESNIECSDATTATSSTSFDSDLSNENNESQDEENGIEIDNDENEDNVSEISDSDSEYEEDDDEGKKPGLQAKAVVLKARKLFKLIRKSEQWSLRLQESCSKFNLKYVRLPSDTKTRWNSTVMMLSKAISMRPAIVALTEEYKKLESYSLSTQEWEALGRLEEYLEPYQTLTEVLSAEQYPTLPSVVTGINLLLDFLEEGITDLGKSESVFDKCLLEALKAGRDKIILHYNKANWIYGMVVLLDPRHKKETFYKTEWGKELVEESEKQFRNALKNYIPLSEPTPSTSSASAPQTVQNKKVKFDPNALYDNTKKSFASTNINQVEKEIEGYFCEPREGSKTNILKYWSDNSARFPTLSAMAKDYLSTPATSVPAERLFSKAGDVIRKKRNRLTPKAAEAQLLVGDWRKSKLYSTIRQYM